MNISHYFSCLVLSMTVTALFAQQDTLRPGSQSRDTVVLTPFTVTEVPERMLQAGISDRPMVHSIPRDVIEVSAPSDLPALLKLLGEADIRQRGMHDVQADISIRGGSFEQTLILINGIPFNDPQTGHHSMNLPFTLDDIERIDVMSPTEGQHLYGGYAIGGVVNIVTRNNSSLSRAVHAQVNGGSYGLRRGYAALQLHTGKWGHYLSLDESFSDGHTHNTDFRRRQLWLNSSTSWRRIHFEIDGGWVNKAFGANSFYSPRFPDQAEEVSATHVSARLSGGEKLRWIVWGSGRLHHDRFELFRNESPAWYGGHNYHRTIVYSGGGELLRTIRYGDLRAGVIVRDEQILSNVLGHVVDSIAVKGAEAWYHRADRRQWSELALSFRSRLARGPEVEGALITALLPNGEVMPLPRVRISPSIKEDAVHVSVGLSRNYRLPTFTEMFYQGPTNTGNPNLTYEEAITTDLSARYQYQTLSIKATLFFRDNRNLIDWVKTSDETIWRSENLTRIHTYGTTMLLHFKPLKPLASIGYASASWSFTDQTKRNPDELISYYVLDHLRHKVSLAAHHHLLEQRLVFVWNVVWQQREGSYTTAEGGEAQYPDALLVDAGVRLRLTPQLMVQGNVNNVLDTRHYDFSGVMHPGRWFSLGLSIKSPW